MAYYKIIQVQSDRLVISNMANPSADYVPVQILGNCIYDSEKDCFALVLKTIDKSVVTEIRNQQCVPFLKVDQSTLISADEYESNKSFDKVQKDDIIEIADWVFKKEDCTRRNFLKSLATLVLPMLLGVSTIPVNLSAKVIDNSKSCNSGCSGSCSGDCSGSCDSGCSGACGTSCHGGCSSSCARACSRQCSSSCSGGCKRECAEGCHNGCYNGCVGSCKFSCRDTCKDSCPRTCSGDCFGGCSGLCTGACSGHCGSTCNGSCLATCTSSNYSKPI